VLGTLLSNPKMTLASVMVLGVASMGLVIKGCGGGQAAAVAKPAAGSVGAVTAKLIVKKPTVVVSEPDTPAGPSKIPRPPPRGKPPAVTSAVSLAGAGQPKTTVRPSDVADWKRLDYEGAVRDGDPRLVAALDYFGGHFAGKASAANFLATLLESSAANPATDAAAGGAARRLPGVHGSVTPSDGKCGAKFTEAAIAALVANGTPRARQVLANLAGGDLKTANRPEAQAAALKALAAHPDPETVELLLRVVTAPVGTAANDSAKLRSVALGLIRDGGSESLAVRLAKVLLAAETPKALHDQLWAFLKEPRPENLAAQILLYQSEEADQAMREWLELRIAACAREAMGRLLRLPATQARPLRSAAAMSGTMGMMSTMGMMGAMPGMATPPRDQPAPVEAVAATDPYRLAERLWSADLAAVIEERLKGMDTLDKSVPLITLAGTVPNPAVRAALLRTLERHWAEGPTELKVLSTAEDMHLEPGFVALVKMLRRKDPVEPPPGGDPAGRNGNRHRSTTQVQVTKKISEFRENSKRQEQMEQKWMEFSQAVVESICRQLYAATRADHSVPRGAARTADDADLPLKLHPHAELVALYHLDWPDDLNGKLAVAPVLRIRYARMQQRAVPVKVLAYYRRQVPDGKSHAISGGNWIDSLVVDQQQARTCSVDVLVTKASKSVLGLPDQEQELTVDVLTIQCDGIAKPKPLPASQ
jgi:hypothetical protein